MGPSGGEGESQRAQPTAAKPRSTPAPAQGARPSAPSDGEDLAEVSGLEAQTVAHMRVPHFGVRYLEQARRQLFARHPDYLPFLVRHLGVHPGMTVVDVGCGTGVYNAYGRHLPASPLAGSDDDDHYRRESAAFEHARVTAGPVAMLLHVCQTCGQLTAPDAVYCQSCHNSIAHECSRCYFSLLPIHERCPRCHTPNGMSVRRAHLGRGGA